MTVFSFFFTDHLRLESTKSGYKAETPKRKFFAKKKESDKH